MGNIFENKPEPLKPEQLFKENPLEKPGEGINWKDLKAKMSIIYDNIDSYMSLLRFAEELKKKYPDYLNYRIYHFLIGSTPSNARKLIEEDFPGEDSVVNFMNSF